MKALRWLMVAALALAAAPVQAEKKFAPGRILVKFRAGMTDDKVGKALGHYKSRSMGKLGQGKLGALHMVEVPAGSEEDYVEAMSLRPDVEFAEVDAMLPPVLIPNDTYFPNSYHLPLIGGPAAWDRSTGNGVTIAILDSGVD